MRWMVILLFAAAAFAEEAAPPSAPPPAAPPVAAAPQTPAEAPVPDCRLRRLAVLDMDMDDSGRITVPVKINGVEKRMMIDTGAQATMLTAETVKELKLATRQSGAIMMGIGRVLGSKAVTVDEFGFGQLKGKNFTLLQLEEPMDSAGLFGPDFLYQFDLDFDFANAKLNLFSPEHCPDKVLYWTRGLYGEVPFELDSNHIMVKVTLDGQEIRAGLDTGAADTIMSLDKASRAFDLDDDKLKKSRHYPFKTLSFGEVSVGNPAILLIPDDESTIMGHHSRDLQMIIGMGVLRRLHLYISYKDKKIYVTPATQN